jgi:hypothetical protein
MVEQVMVSNKKIWRAQFPDWITADTRAGFSGYIVSTEHLLEFAKSCAIDGL